MEILKIVLMALGVFAVFYALAYGSVKLFSRFRKQKKRGGSHSKPSEKTGLDFNKMDLILLVIIVGLVLFTLKMIDLFETHTATPDVLITCVFGFAGGECGMMAAIKNAKEKYRERKWALEDEKRMEAAAKRAAGPHDQ